MLRQLDFMAEEHAMNVVKVKGVRIWPGGNGGDE